ncbi:oxidoreductase [Mesorhizobium sp. LNHC220B00]|nr:oxidoreductase [Mesorhizobium sp. LNHC220B00]
MAPFPARARCRRPPRGNRGRSPRGTGPPCRHRRHRGSSLGAYPASKAAPVGLTKALARDLGSRGITANAVHPGSTDTDMNPADGPHAEHQRQKMATPRFGEADNIAGMFAWLAGPEGRFVTGAALTIDRGANA